MAHPSLHLVQQVLENKPKNDGAYIFMELSPVLFIESRLDLLIATRFPVPIRERFAYLYEVLEKKGGP